jgi:hypothetical protein
LIELPQVRLNAGRRPRAGFVGARPAASLHGGSERDDLLVRHAVGDLRQLVRRQGRVSDAQTIQVPGLRTAREGGRIASRNLPTSAMLACGAKRTATMAPSAGAEAVW